MVYWARLCNSLLRVTGQSKYADELEKTIYNALLAAMAPDGAAGKSGSAVNGWNYYNPLLGNRAYNTSLGEDEFYPYNQNGVTNWTCCSANGPRILMMTPFISVMSDSEGPVINLFNAGTYKITLPSGHYVELVQQTDYPKSGLINIIVKPQVPGETFKIKVRIPKWSTVDGNYTSLKINSGSNLSITTGTYTTLNQAWNLNDEIKLSLDMRAKLQEISDCSGNTYCAVNYGPLVLARDSRFGGNIDENIKPETALVGTEKIVQGFSSITAPSGMNMAFSMNSSKGTLKMTDFGSAGNQFSTSNTYRVWMQEDIEGSGIIVDDNDSGAAYTGTWTRNTDIPGQQYSGGYHYAAQGSGSMYTTFTPDIPTAGSYNVYAWWPTCSGYRASNVPFTIYYNGGNRTIPVDQRSNGGQWNLLGTFDFAVGASGYVKLTNNADNYVVADAVKFELVGSTTPTPTPTPTFTPTPAPPIIVDDNDSGAVYTGTWVRNTDIPGQQYSDGYRYAAQGSGSIDATFTPNIITAGIYKVYAWWTTYTGCRASNVPFTIYYNGGNQTIPVDQRSNGGQWNLLGMFDFAVGTSGYVKLTNNADNYVIADAVKFEKQ